MTLWTECFRFSTSLEAHDTDRGMFYSTSWIYTQ